MTITKDTLQFKWDELKSQIHQQWGKLTDEDLSRLNGGMDELTILLRKRYGYGKAQAEFEINKWFKDLEPHLRNQKR